MPPFSLQFHDSPRDVLSVICATDDRDDSKVTDLNIKYLGTGLGLFSYSIEHESLHLGILTSFLK
jgi:hypothetical protein